MGLKGEISTTSSCSRQSWPAWKHVAIDALGATFLGLRAEQIPYIMIGHTRGLGNKNYSELQVKYVNLE